MWGTRGGWKVGRERRSVGESCVWEGRGRMMVSCEDRVIVGELCVGSAGMLESVGSWGYGCCLVGEEGSWVVRSSGRTEAIEGVASVVERVGQLVWTIWMFC